jgi:putative ABC transport system permease protein
MLRRHGAFVAFATASLALAVGATLTVFTVVNALWLRPLPYPEPDRLVTLVYDAGSEDPAYYGIDTSYSARWAPFESVAGQVVTSGWHADVALPLVIDEVGHEVETLAVTAKYFSLFSQSIRGRDFTLDDNRGAAEPVAIISDRLWTRAFGRRSDIIGATVAARPFPVRIIGVAPVRFQGARRGEQTDLWIPSNLMPRLTADGKANQDDSVATIVFARLRPGQTPSEARDRLLQALSDERSRLSLRGVQVVPIASVFGTPESRAVVIREGGAATVVGGLACLVLLAGCATLMALVLVHYERRRRELAVRVALGASRVTLVRELSGELAWIAAAGGVGALLVSFWSLRALPSLSLPGGVDLGRLDLSIDARVLLAGLLTTVVTLAGAALVPIRRFTRADLAGDLIASNATSPRSSQRLRQCLLGAHVAATIVVLIAAGLFVRAVIYGFGAGPGFDIDRTAYVVAQVVPSPSAIDQITQRLALAFERDRQIRERLLSLPGVEEVAVGWAPIGPDPATSLLTPKHVETTDGRRELKVGEYVASPELLTALGVPILKGRSLTAADAATHPTPGIVTASLARTLWPNAEPLGQIVSLGARGGRGYGRYTVVGIAPDFAYGSLTDAAAGVVVSVRSGGFGIASMLVVRTARPELQVEAMRTVVKAVAPDAPRLVITTGREIMARDLGRQRLGAWFFSGFGLVALVLGAGGVFGLVASLAESRRREFGVRLALGATPRDLVWRGVAAGLTPAAIGTGLGLVCAAIVSRIFVAVLPGLSALDPATHTGVALLMIGCATASGLSAAWRLRRLAPGEALRAE